MSMNWYIQIKISGLKRTKITVVEEIKLEQAKITLNRRRVAPPITSLLLNLKYGSIFFLPLSFTGVTYNEQNCTMRLSSMLQGSIWNYSGSIVFTVCSIVQSFYSVSVHSSLSGMMPKRLISLCYEVDEQIQWTRALLEGFFC